MLNPTPEELAETCTPFPPSPFVPFLSSFRCVDYYKKLKCLIDKRNKPPVSLKYSKYLEISSTYKSCSNHRKFDFNPIVPPSTVLLLRTLPDQRGRNHARKSCSSSEALIYYETRRSWIRHRHHPRRGMG